MSSKLIAGQKFPHLIVPSLNSGGLNLAQPGEGYDWKMLVVYRGKHCPLCTRYLKQLNSVLPKLNQLGIDVVAVSTDPKEKAESHISQVEPDYEVGYDLSTEQMQQLGLYISNPRSAAETDRPFAEPGLFVINEQGQLQVVDISNGPFVRPELEPLVNGLAYIRDPENNYPIRGTYSS